VNGWNEEKNRVFALKLEEITAAARTRSESTRYSNNHACAFLLYNLHSKLSTLHCCFRETLSQTPPSPFPNARFSTFRR